MSSAVEALILDMAEWIGREPRAYEEVMAAWRTSCPRLTVWEDAVDRGLVESFASAEGAVVVRLTGAGCALLERNGRGSVPTAAAFAGRAASPLLDHPTRH